MLVWEKFGVDNVGVLVLLLFSFSLKGIFPIDVAKGTNYWGLKENKGPGHRWRGASLSPRFGGSRFPAFGRRERLLLRLLSFYRRDPGIPKPAFPASLGAGLQPPLPLLRAFATL